MYTSGQVAVHVVPGTPIREWCDQCHTSAALKIPIHGLADIDGPTVLNIDTLTACTRCDADLFGD